MTEKTLFKILEGLLLCCSTVPDSLPGYSGKLRSDGGELWEELVIEATNTEERANVLRILCTGQSDMVCSFSGTGRIHLRPTMKPTTSISYLAKEHFLSVTKS